LAEVKQCTDISYEIVAIHNRDACGRYLCHADSNRPPCKLLGQVPKPHAKREEATLGIKVLFDREPKRAPNYFRRGRKLVPTWSSEDGRIRQPLFNRLVSR
jgi:hypothetical protein